MQAPLLISRFGLGSARCSGYKRIDELRSCSQGASVSFVPPSDRRSNPAQLERHNTTADRVEDLGSSVARIMNVISILYHDVVRCGEFESSGFLIPGAKRYKLFSEEFDRHLKAIADAIQRKPATLAKFEKESEEKQLLFTFDDGGASSHSVIADALESYGWRGHFLVATDFIDRPRFLTRWQIRELRNRGHVIGSHSCSHPLQMSRCSPSQLNQEWTQSVRVLEDILGEPVEVASVPGGAYSKNVAEAAVAAGIRALFTSEPTTICCRVGAMLVLGRFTIRRGVASYVVAGLASGRALQHFRQFASWKTRSIIKSVGGKYYVELRNALLR